MSHHNHWQIDDDDDDVTAAIFIINITIITPPQHLLQRRHYVCALSVTASVSCHRYLFHFARILNGFRQNPSQVITSTNISDNYVLGKSETGTRQPDTTEYSNRR